jgi:N-methylhydantoinase B
MCVPLPSRSTLRVDPGDIVTLITPGGGGWGDPAERSRDAVAQDVREGLVSPERAGTIYRYGDDV